MTMKKRFNVNMDFLNCDGKVEDNYDFAIWAESRVDAIVEAKNLAVEQIEGDYGTDYTYTLSNIVAEEDIDDVLLFKYYGYGGEREPELCYSTMTVGELISKLCQYPTDMNINFVCQTFRTAYQNFTDAELVLMSDIDWEADNVQV